MFLIKSLFSFQRFIQQRTALIDQQINIYSWFAFCRPSRGEVGQLFGYFCYYQLATFVTTMVIASFLLLIYTCLVMTGLLIVQTMTNSLNI